MNRYYSNLIEGHDTHPVDIESALKKRLQRQRGKSATSNSKRKRTSRSRNGSTRADCGRTVARMVFKEIHGRFANSCRMNCWVEDPDNGERMEVVRRASRTRRQSRPTHSGQSRRTPSFFQQFERTYGLAKAETIIAGGGSHHRLLWIHLFLDGNGRGSAHVALDV